MNSEKRILLICTTSHSVITFRKNLLIKLLEKGHSVFVVAFDEFYKEEIEKQNIHFLDALYLQCFSRFNCS